MGTRAGANLVRQIEHFSVFAAFDRDDLNALARVVRLREYRRGEPIYLPGHEITSMYFLLKGCVKVTRCDPASGKEIILYIVRPGELFGLLPASGTDAGTSAVAVKKCVVGSMLGRDFDKLARNREFTAELNQVLQARLRRIVARLDELMFRSARSRLARLLVRLDEEFPDASPGETRITLTQQELADMIGATRERTNILLNEFKRLGLIELGHGVVSLRDREQLDAIGA